ncbi:hypothetical protein Tco_0143763, partial [Tanacetum coccineum]
TNPNVLVDKTKSTRDGLETIHTKTGTDKEASRAEKEAIFDQDEFKTSPKLTSYEDAKEIKIKDLSKLVKDVGIDLIDLDSLEDDTPFIAKDDEDEEVHAKLLALPGQVSSITAQLSKLKVMDALPILLIKATEALNRFATAIASTSQKMALKDLPSTRRELIKNKGKEAMSHDEAEEKGSESDSETEVKLLCSMVESSNKKRLKIFAFIAEQGETILMIEEQLEYQNKVEQNIKVDMAKKEVELGREELVDLLGIDVVTNLYKAKLKYDKYCDKMLNRRALGKITNYDASDLHLSEWREVMNVCPKRTGARWTTIYSQINQRMINLHKTKAELELDFNKPLGEQDPIIKMNDLARKKKKHADDIHDYFGSTKRYKSSVKYKDHPAGTILNEPSLGMILFNSHQRQDFVNTEDFGDLSNEMLYTVYEIFFRLHQGPGQDDHARTFSSFLLAEVDKRNLNPLKQMRVIEQLG